MASLVQESCFMLKSPHAPNLKSNQKKKMIIMSALNIPNQRATNFPLTNLQKGRVLLMEKLEFGLTDRKPNSIFNIVPDNSMAVNKIQAILEAIADRIEMHKNIGEQRSNWNTLLLTSINGITLAAATMSGIVAATTTSDLTALKLSCTILYLSATFLLIIMNKIQPSQLVEEQRNATRLFQQLHNQIQNLAKVTVTNKDVKEAMEKVLALDKAYPLPLLGAMLEKFPSSMQPAVWWPQQRQQQQQPKHKKQENDMMEWNGWNVGLEKEMRQVVEVIRKKDEADYLRLGAKALKMNKILAVTGPLLTGMAAIGSAFGLVGSSWGPVLGIVGGALASVVNTIEHGGQVGMVFEMYRNNAGFFKFMEECIESNLMETEVQRRENGELLELKVALQLGRSLSGLRQFASSSSNQTDEFASKIF